MNYWPSLTTGEFVYFSVEPKENPRVFGPNYVVVIALTSEFGDTPDLADLTSPLHDLISNMSQRGITVAQNMYHCQGSVTHHNTDIWGDSAPQDNYISSTWWPMGATWLVTEILEHYRFTGDKRVLQAMYPALRASVEFALDFLTDYEGWMVTNPSLSPEDAYYVPGTQTQQAVTLGPTIDNSMLWELFGGIIETHDELGISDAELNSQVMEMRAKLPPLRINQYGGIAEWIHDYEEVCTHTVKTAPS